MQQPMQQPIQPPASAAQPGPDDPEALNFMVVNGIRYFILQKLGGGASGSVFSVYSRKHGLCAMKAIILKATPEDGGESAAEAAVQAEVNIMRRLSGLNASLDFVDFGIQTTRRNTARMACIVMKLGCQDFRTYLHNHPELSEPQIALFVQDICFCVQKMHEAGFIHGDIKPQNFVFSGDGHLRLIDFGISKRMEGDTTMIFREMPAGTLKYMAPETFWHNPAEAQAIHRAADVWSVGCMIYECVVGKTPLDGLVQQFGSNILSLMLAVERGQFTIDFSFACSDNLKDLIQRCLERDASRRISIPEIMQHPFMAGMVPLQQKR